MKDIKIKDFVKSEIDFLKANCNFTEAEEKYFDLKCKDASDVEIGFSLNISDRSVSDKSQAVKTKIIKVAIS